MAKIHLKQIRPHVDLYRDSLTGIAWIEDGTNGTGASCHANINKTGSVRGMKARGYWQKEDRTVRSHGFIYNVDSRVIHGELDKIAADNCRCIGCRDRR